MTDLPAINAEARRFIREMVTGQPSPPPPDRLDIGTAIMDAALEAKAAGETIAHTRNADEAAIATARAAVRTITEQLDWMEGRT